MSNEIILTREQCKAIWDTQLVIYHYSINQSIRIIQVVEQAILQSAEFQAFQKDAERYRHLRECNSGSLVVLHITGAGEDDQVVLTEEDADSAIDAAIAKATGETNAKA